MIREKMRIFGWNLAKFPFFDLDASEACVLVLPTEAELAEAFKTDGQQDCEVKNEVPVHNFQCANQSLFGVNNNIVQRHRLRGRTRGKTSRCYHRFMGARTIPIHFTNLCGGNRLVILQVIRTLQAILLSIFKSFCHHYFIIDFERCIDNPRSSFHDGVSQRLIPLASSDRKCHNDQCAFLANRLHSPNPTKEPKRSGVRVSTWKELA